MGIYNAYKIYIIQVCVPYYIRLLKNMIVVGLGHQSQLWWLRTTTANLSATQKEGLAFPLPAYSYCLACINVSHQMVTWSLGSLLVWLTSSLYDLNWQQGTDAERQECSVFHCMLWLGVQTCCLCGLNRFLRGALGWVNPTVKSYVWRQSHCPLKSSSNVVVWWHCEIWTFLNCMAWRGEQSPFCHP